VFSSLQYGVPLLQSGNHHGQKPWGTRAQTIRFDWQNRDIGHPLAAVCHKGGGSDQREVDESDDHRSQKPALR